FGGRPVSILILGSTRSGRDVLREGGVVTTDLMTRARAGDGRASSTPTFAVVAMVPLEGHPWHPDRAITRTTEPGPGRVSAGRVFVVDARTGAPSLARRSMASSVAVSFSGCGWSQLGCSSQPPMMAALKRRRAPTTKAYAQE